jgi:6,7-dimethyl-8-ribityllumazine synthase
MATHLKNLSEFDPTTLPSSKNMRFVIVVSDWNKEITEPLLKGAYDTLITTGSNPDNIVVEHVPGSFEIPYTAKLLAEHLKPDAVICLGCVIQGETRHFDYICQSVTHGISELNLSYKMPFIFGVLTTKNMEQALERAGGTYGNKGVDAAVTAIKMVAVKMKFED